MDTSCVNIKTLPKTPQQKDTPDGVVTAPVALTVKQQQELLKAKYTKLKRK